MRVHYLGEEFISIDEIREVWGITIYDGLFDSVYTPDKFMLIKEDTRNELMMVIQKLKISIYNPIINDITLLTVNMLDEKIQESDVIGFIESDFNKFVSVKYMDDFYKHNQLL